MWTILCVWGVCVCVGGEDGTRTSCSIFTYSYDINPNVMESCLHTQKTERNEDVSVRSTTPNCKHTLIRILNEAKTTLWLFAPPL
jgi:hypothetical protein